VGGGGGGRVAKRRSSTAVSKTMRGSCASYRRGSFLRSNVTAYSMARLKKTLEQTHMALLNYFSVAK
jgi:hypothetical protein